MTRTWFTADSHFGHRGILKHCAKTRGRFAFVEEMDVALIDAWNSRVGPHDTVYHLGDVSFHRAEQTAYILYHLRGRIHLIRGNHDRLGDEMVVRRFMTVNDYQKISIDGQKVVLCHYPLLTWDGAHRGSWMLHGHSHGGLRAPMTTRLDVGVDARPSGDLSPWSWEEVQDALVGRVYKSVDHHGE